MLDKDVFAAYGIVLLAIAVSVGFISGVSIWFDSRAPETLERWKRENLAVSRFFWVAALVLAGLGSILLVVAGVMALLEVWF